MNREELFKKYHIDESHNIWEPPDEWYNVDVYLEMGGDETQKNGECFKFVTDFLDKCRSDLKWAMKLKVKDPLRFGSMYLTSKRMVYKYADKILDELNGE